MLRFVIKTYFHLRVKYLKKSLINDLRVLITSNYNNILALAHLHDIKSFNILILFTVFY